LINVRRAYFDGCDPGYSRAVLKAGKTQEPTGYDSMYARKVGKISSTVGIDLQSAMVRRTTAPSQDAPIPLVEG